MSVNILSSARLPTVQRNLFYSQDSDKHARIMEVMDPVNAGFNNRLLSLGSQGTTRKWTLRRARLSPDYTTDIKQIITVKAV